MTRTSPLRLAPVEDQGAVHFSSHRCVTPRDQEADVRGAICRARCALLAEQRADGAWCGRQHGDASFAARLLLLDLYLDRNHDRAATLARAIRDAQAPDGAWPARPGGPADLSISVLAYLALKASGASAADAGMRSARHAIHTLGGLAAVGGEATVWLRLFGQAPWGAAGRSAKPLAPLRGVQELHADDDARAPGLWSRLRRGARRRVLAPRSGGARDTVSRALATRARSRGADGDYESCDKFIESLVNASDDAARLDLAPSASPLLDSALAVTALARSGAGREHPATVEAVRSLMDETESTIGSVSNVELCVVLDALRVAQVEGDGAGGFLPPGLSVLRDERRAGPSDGLYEAVGELGERLSAELMRRRHRDGGWRPARGRSAADVTGIALHAIAGWRGSDGSGLDKSVQFLRRAQRADGSWSAEWAAGRVFATSRALAGLVAAGVAADDPIVEAGANWLIAQQLSCGAWGESVQQPSSHERNCARATATHTAWAVEGLVAAGMASDEACWRGVALLVDTQDEDGDWREPHFTLAGTSPGAWRRNELYPCVFALRALSSWVVAERGATRSVDDVCIRLVDPATVEA